MSASALVCLAPGSEETEAVTTIAVSYTHLTLPTT